ncbi:MAG: hypothetical protein JST05_11475 [Acidobacteria bacterium]|nr:hypothetical protein [Acidobacteriota bacterium]
MPSPFRTRQAGEGKVGCIVTVLLLLIAIGVAVKAGPIYYSNNELVNAINSDIGPSASRARSDMPVDELAAQVTSQIRAKAKDLEIPEALKPGAVTVTVTSGGSDAPGNVHVVLRYSRTADFYGVYSYDFDTNQTLDITIMTNIK